MAIAVTFLYGETRVQNFFFGSPLGLGLTFHTLKFRGATGVLSDHL